MLESTISLEYGLPFLLYPCQENVPVPAKKPVDECREVSLSLRGD